SNFSEHLLMIDHLQAPDAPAGVRIDDTSIAWWIHVAREDDLGAIEIGAVIHPLLEHIMMWRIAHENQVPPRLRIELLNNRCATRRKRDKRRCMQAFGELTD